MSDPKAYLDANRTQWDERARIHARDETGFYGIEAFKRGEGRLYPIEDAELGRVAGLRLAHLQCHIGLDTLMLARMGAAATGLDFSGEAIATARQLAKDADIAADFVEGDVYAARAVLSGDFDVVYTSWGTLNWLPDVGRWTQTVASLLKPGGFVYIADGHPTLHQLEEVDGKLEFWFDRSTPVDRPLSFEQENTYTGASDSLHNTRSFEWPHPISEILTSLIAAGLTIEMFHEHDRIPWRAFPMLVRDNADERMFRLPDHHPKLPLAYSLRARKL